jgi:type II secretory pathway component HofQ
MVFGASATTSGFGWDAKRTLKTYSPGACAPPGTKGVQHVMTVKNVPAGFLVPILRPLLPQTATLAAFPRSNSLLMSDTFANVKRIETLVEALDVGIPYKLPEKCELPVPTSRRD